MRERAGIVIYNKYENKVLLVRRKKNEKNYCVIPGGGVEEYETSEQAAIREIFEELRIKINLNEIIPFFEIKNSNVMEKYYLYNSIDTREYVIHGEEKKRSSKDNIYQPCWISISEIENVNLYPIEARMYISKLITL